MAASSGPTIHLKDYVVTEKLGSGSYGDVYKAYKKSGPREVVAVKCVVRNKLRKFEIDNLVNEIALLKKLKHPNIVELKDFCWDSNYIYIVMEYCGGGDLSRFIRSRRVLAEDICRRFLQQLAAALLFLRSKNISHMDLKPQNILLESRSNPVLKLGDFGFALHFSDDQTKNAIRGSPLYMAPEMLLDRKYDAKVDLWSVGVILYECLFGVAPYKSESIEELMAKIREDKPIVIPRSVRISKNCHDFLCRCLQRDPTKRIDFDEFFAHDFLDLEHMPSEESAAKALSLVGIAVKADSNGDFEEALKMYQAALEYFVPLVLEERNVTKKQALRKRTDEYIKRAEELKSLVRPNSTMFRQTSDSCRQRQMYWADAKSEELVKLCSMTPQLKVGVEIAQAAESYEREGQYQVSLEKYEQALGILIPLLSSEPKGHRKAVLKEEVTRWMARAEAVKELLRIQKEVISENMDMTDSSSHKQSCILQ